MKVALLTPSKSAYSETFIANHIKHLPFDVTVVYGGNFPTTVDGFSISKKELATYKVSNKIQTMAGKSYTSPAVYRLKKIFEEYQIEHVFCEYLFTGAEVVKVCKALGLPMSAIALGYDISQYAILEQYALKYKALFEYADTLFVVSNHMKKQMIAMGCDEAKIKWTPAGPDPQFFDIEPDRDSRQFFGLGRFVDKKAPHVTILAFYKVLQEFPDATLVLGGDGELLSYCEDLVTGLGIVHAVSLVGRTTIEQQNEYLKNAIAFVQHSRIAVSGDSEGTPVAILEASASSLPIVATLHAGIPDVVQQSKTGLLGEEGDVNAMAANMIKLLKDPVLAKSLGEAGRDFVKENFTLENHIKTLASYIEKSVQS